MSVTPSGGEARYDLLCTVEQKNQRSSCRLFAAVEYPQEQATHLRAVDSTHGHLRALGMYVSHCQAQCMAAVDVDAYAFSDQLHTDAVNKSSCKDLRLVESSMQITPSLTCATSSSLSMSNESASFWITFAI